MRLLLPILALAGFALANNASCLPENVQVTRVNGRRTCTVHPRGAEQDDAPVLAKVFKICGSNATVVFPENETFWIASKLHITLENVDIDWRSKWLVSAVATRL